MTQEQMPEWLLYALNNPEWVKQQQEAWERLGKPGSLGASPPRFVLLSEQNPESALTEVARHFQQLAQRHQATAQAIEKIGAGCPVRLY